MKKKLLTMTLVLIFLQNAWSQTVELSHDELTKITDFQYIYPFTEKLSKVMKDGKWGYINYGGEVKIPLKYDDAASFIDNVARVRLGAKFSAINAEGKQIMPWFDYVYPFYNELAKVRNRNQVAFVNKNGKILSDWFDAAYVYYYGLQKVRKGYKWAFIDKNAKIVTQWYFNQDSLHKSILVKTSQNKDKVKTVAIYNEKNERISDIFPAVFWTQNFANPSLFDSLRYDKELALTHRELFTENISMIRSKDGKFGFINDGGELITNWYLRAENFYEGVATVMNEDGKMAYLGANGKQITSWLDEVMPFYNRLALVKNADKYSFIDKTGEFVTDWFDYASPFSDGLAKVGKDRKWGYIDSDGKLVIGLKFDDATSFSYGFAQVESEGRVLMINKKGQVLHDAFDFAFRFTDSIAPIKYKNKYAYINQKGKIITDWFDKASEFSFGMARVEKDKKVAIINNKGNFISPWYETAFFVYPQLILGDTLPHGKIGRYIYFDMSIYDRHFRKYSGSFDYDDSPQMAWNYTDREVTQSWNDGFFKESVHTVYKQPEKKHSSEAYEGVALADFNEKLLTPWYKEIYKSEDSLILAQIEEKFMLLNIYGDTISREYDGIFYHKPNQLMVRLGEKYAFMNFSDSIISDWYDDISDFKDGFAVVKIEEKFALMTEDFKVISQNYDYIDNEFTYGMRRVKNGELWGAINNIGYEAAEVKYEQADFINNLVRVKLTGANYFFDSNGNLIKQE